MKQTQMAALIAVVATLIVGVPSIFADTLDSLVTIATKAQAQVQFQLQRAQNVPDDLKSLFEQGSNETDMLISSAKQGDVAQAKQHFLSAMKAFKQVSVGLSSPQENTSQKTAIAPPVSQSTLNSYRDSIDRTEKYASMLKDLVAKNNFTVDFSRVDKLVENARSSLAANDIPSVDKIFVDLKSALTDIQNAIKEQTIQNQNDRAKSFANDYIAKINAMLLRADQLGLSEDDIAKLNKAKEEIASTTDPNMLIVIIKHYSFNFTASDVPVQNQSVLENVSKLDARLTAIEPYTDDTIKPRFEEAKQIISQLRGATSDDSMKQLDSLESMVSNMEEYVQSKQKETQSAQTRELTVKSEEQKPAEPQIKPEENQQEAKNAEAKNQQNPQLSRLEARLAGIEPFVDDSIKPRYETAQSLLLKLKNQGTTSKGEYDMTMRVLNFLVDDLEKKVKLMQEHEKNASKNDASQNKNSDKKR